MNLSGLKTVVTSKLGRQVLTGKKHAPLILFAVGTVGVVTAAVIACRATLKLEEVLDEADNNITELKDRRDSEDMTEKEFSRAASKVYFKAGAKIAGMYAPAALLLAGSIAALTGSHVMLTNRYAGMVSAYAALDKGFKAYRERVVEKLGKDQDQEFRYGTQELEIVEEAADGSGPVVKTIKRAAPTADTIYARWFDSGSNMWNKEAALNYVFLKSQEEHWNYRLGLKGYVTLNEVYENLGLPRKKFGQIVGWTKDAHQRGTGDGYISFGIFEGKTEGARDFINGWNSSVLLDFNVDGNILDEIDKHEVY